MVFVIKNRLPASAVVGNRQNCLELPFYKTFKLTIWDSTLHPWLIFSDLFLLRHGMMVGSESTTFHIIDTGSHQLPVSLIWRFSYSPITDMDRRLSISSIQRYFWTKNSDSNSVDFWYGESETYRITDTGSQRLSLSLMRRVSDSPNQDTWSLNISDYKYLC